MPDKKNRDSDQGHGISKSRSAQSGPPDDKPRDSTQRGDQTGQQTQGGNRRDKETEQQNEQDQADDAERARSRRGTIDEK